MPKQAKKHSSEEEEEEDDSIGESFEDEEGSDDDQFQGDDSDNEIEVDKAHLLNYESDSSDDQDELEDDSDNFDNQLKKQKEELLLNDTWGTKKKNFYGRDKKQDDASSSEADEDEYQEALRLQKIRAKKLNMQLAEDQEQDKEVQHQEFESDSDSDSESDQEKTQKLGDRLFADNKKDMDHLKEMTQLLDKKALKQIIEKESPELKSLLQEFEDSLSILNNQLIPILESKVTVVKSKQLLTYIEMKYNLLLSYCTFLSFYLLLKIEGKPIKDHPVLFKLTNIKALLDSLIPFDDRINPSLERMLRQSKRKLKVKQISDEEEEIEGDLDESLEVKKRSSKKKSKKEQRLEDELEQDDEDQGDELDYGDEDEIDDLEEEEEEAQMTKKDLKRLKKRETKLLKQRLETIDEMDDIKKIIADGKKKREKKVTVQDLKVQEKPAKKYTEEDENNGDLENPLKRQKISFTDLKTQAVKGDEVYEAQKQKMRDKKRQKKEQNKEKRMEELYQVEKMDQNIQRNINYTIMKSKGLTRKRKKIDRNSRVKLREKYRKAVQKRKSTVQEFKVGPKGKYAGESTGVTARLIKSTSLT